MVGKQRKVKNSSPILGDVNSPSQKKNVGKNYIYKQNRKQKLAIWKGWIFSFSCDFCDSDFWGGFFKRRGKPTGQCPTLYREPDFSWPNIAENPRVGKFPLKTSLETLHLQVALSNGSVEEIFTMKYWCCFICILDLHWLLTNPYPKKCLVENFLYKHWNQKKKSPPPRTKKSSKIFMSFQFRCHFLWCFFLR